MCLLGYLMMLSIIFGLEKLMCSSPLEDNKTDVVEGDTVTLMCDVTYYGNWTPHLEWKDVHENLTKPSYQDNGTSRTVTLEYKFIAHDTPNMDFLCKLSFNEDHKPTGETGDPSNFTTDCMQSINVKCKYGYSTFPHPSQAGFSNHQ